MRTRYWWDPVTKQLLTHPPEERKARLEILTDAPAYDGLRTVDGVDISSRRKRADYMKANGLADFSDYSPETLEKNKLERWNSLESKPEIEARKRAICDAIERLRGKR
jgi:hypothetical protein